MKNKSSGELFIYFKSYLQKHAIYIVVLGIILAASIIRINIYGDPGLSIATNDTQSYVESSQSPLFSSEMITGRRLLTTNIIYKIFEPKEGYKIKANGSVDTTRRVFQRGFDKIVVFQLFLSIIGWGILAFTISKSIRTPSLKVLSTIIIMLFAFSPQLADWDSVLMAESMNFSLFALQLAILIKLVFSLYKDPNSNATIWLSLWMVIYFLWTFIRPTNLFVSFVTLAMLAGMLLFVKYRKSKHLYSAILFSASLFIIGAVTTGQSERSQNYDVYQDDLLIYPERVSILKEWGMPDPSSPEFQPWFEKYSTKTMLRFMVTYPGYPTNKIIKDFPQAFNVANQTYFKAPEQWRARNIMIPIGESFHPENTSPFLLNLFMLFCLILIAFKNTKGISRPWAWIGIWLFLSAGVTMILAIIGDTWGLNRHALFSTMVYRILMWINLIVIMDIAITNSTQNNDLSLQPQK